MGWWWWGGGPCDFSVSPSPFGLDFGTLDFGTSDSGLTICWMVVEVCWLFFIFSNFSRCSTLSLYCLSFSCPSRLIFKLISYSFILAAKVSCKNQNWYDKWSMGRTFKNWYSISEGWSGGSNWSSKLSSRVEQDLSFFLIFLDISFKSGVPPQYKSFYQQSFFCSSVRDSKMSDNSCTGDSIRSMMLKLSVFTFKSLI